MVGITEVTYLATFYWIFSDFGWRVFKQLGADRRIKRAYATYQVFLCILKFDGFFFVAFSLQLVLLVLQQNDTEVRSALSPKPKAEAELTPMQRWLTVAALPVTIIILLMGYFAVRRENNSLFWAFFGGCLVGAAYFVYKVPFFTLIDELAADPLPSQLIQIYKNRATDYQLVFKSLTVFASLCFAALLCTCIVGGLCYRNFDKGLRYHRQSITAPPVDHRRS